MRAALAVGKCTRLDRREDVQRAEWRIIRASPGVNRPDQPSARRDVEVHQVCR
ncbi:hypothetical protein [Mycolicibacterium elephantis]|uniref:hypothetical protein n=1 Tax=Mycolicibacterium elephantis TaxID=81858 RepID=UPI000A7B526A|nr:hypothetical protein [Mycolicibacterium elephantis]